MAINSSCISSIIESVNKHSDVPYSTKNKIERELNHLKTFSLCVESWSSVDVEVRESLADLMADIESEFADASLDLDDAEDGGKEKLIEAYSELQDKIEQLKPKMVERYVYLSQYCFQARLSVTDIVFWNEIISDIYSGLTSLPSYIKMAAPLKRQVEAFTVNFRCLNLLLIYLNHYLSEVKTFMPLWVYLGCVATCAAQVSYMCWVDGMNANKAQDLIFLISDLQPKMMPCTSETIDVYIGLLKALNSCKSYYTNSCVKAIIVYCFSIKNHSESVRMGLGFFLQFLVTTPDEFSDDVKLVSLDMKILIAKIASLDCTLTRKKSEREVELFQLVGKIEILKAEAVLMGLINRSTEDKSPSENPSESLLEGVKMLHTFIINPPKGINEQGKLILTHIEAVAIGSASLYNTFHANPLSEDVIRDVLKLLVNIKLLKAQIFWLELINKSSNLKDKVGTLIEGLEGLRNIVSGKPNADLENGQLILVRVDQVACQAMSGYHSINSSKGIDNIILEMESQLPDLLDKICVVKNELENIYVLVRNSSRFNFPMTNRYGFFEFFLENLRKLLNHNPNSGSSVKHLMEAVLTDMESLRSFLRDTAEHCKVHDDLGDLHSRILNMSYEADYTIDSIVLRNGAVWYHTLCLSDITKEIKLLKSKVAEITEKKNYESVAAPAPQTSSDKISKDSAPLIKEVIVNLKDQEKVIIDQLTRGSRRRDIISIVGMGGIGKTTLAKKVFNDHSVREDFNVRAWCSVSVTYQKRDLLMEILSYVPKPICLVKKDSDEDMSDLHEQKDEFDKDTDDDIAHKLYQRLMGRKYFIVMDDLWDIQAWRDIQMSFPDESNGSKILFTCRDSLVASKASGTIEPHPLRELSPDESWKLLETKVFHGKDCPEKLVKIGKRIASGCKGLPLAVVAIGGLLERTNQTIDWWKEVADDINTHIAEDPQSHCMNILELSYKHLPDNLKPCFLYFGAFWGNKEIPVKKLLLLWIAEGLVSKVDSNRLIEDVAEAYLEELVSRSMVVATKERSQGGFKSCRVHDMLRTLCLSKAEHENFLQPITGYGKFFPQCADYGIDPDYLGPTLAYEQHRISILSKRNHLAMLKPSCTQARSLLFSPVTDTYPRCPYNVSFIVQNFRLLRVLDLETINMGSSFIFGIELVKHLIYLAVSGDIDSVPSTVAELFNLETLFVKGLKGQVVIPVDIWSLESLRHLHVNDTATFRLPPTDDSSKLCHLITLSTPTLSCRESAQNMMKRLPGLKKLKCKFSKSHDHSMECRLFPILIKLTKLESLKISYYNEIPSSCEFNFCSSLKKLSISYCHLPDNYVSIIGKLPDLTVLKLLNVAFENERWIMKDEEFLSLKYLKLDNVVISEWVACDNPFPGLRRLVLNNCKKLEEVPYIFHEIAALHTIELQLCSMSVEDSAKEIQTGKQELGNDKSKFKLFINLLEWDHISS